MNFASGGNRYVDGYSRPLRQQRSCATMPQPSDHLFTQALNALLFVAFTGLVIGLWREPAKSAFTLRGEPSAAAGTLKRLPAASSAASPLKPTATKAADRPSEIKCKIGLASCRKWIALQKQKGRPPAHSAQRH